MAEPKSCSFYGNQITILMDDGRKILALPTVSNMWVVSTSAPGPGPGPTDGYFVFPFSLDAVDPANGYQTPSRPGHDGIDFSNGLVGNGDVITCAADGVVANHIPNHAGWGNVVMVQHSVPGHGTVTTLYAHQIAGSVVVSVGASIKRGDKIGLVGNTGASFGAHLHFETWEGTVLTAHRDPIAAIPEWNAAF